MRKRSSRLFLIIHTDLNRKLCFIRSCLIFLFLILTLSTSGGRPPNNYRYHTSVTKQKMVSVEAGLGQQIRLAGFFFLQVGGLLHKTNPCVWAVPAAISGTGLCSSRCCSAYRVTVVTLDNATRCKCNKTLLHKQRLISIRTLTVTALYSLLIEKIVGLQTSPRAEAFWVPWVAIMQYDAFSSQPCD